MKTAIVILNWNGRTLLEKFLPSVVRHSLDATVYVADNASSDGSVDYVKTVFPTVKIIQNTENGGFAKGYNDALSGLEEELFILLNSDVETPENWLLPLVSHFETHPGTAIGQPKILDYKRKDHFEYAGASGGYIDRLGYPYCRGRIFDTVEKDVGQYDDATEILWASGACFAIRRSCFEKLGGFDEAYFAHQEEIDICWRAHNHGFQCMVIPQSAVYHLGGATLDAMSPRKTFLNFRNSLFNILKNVPGKHYRKIIFLRLVLDGIAGIKFLLSGKPRHTWAILKAHSSFYRHYSEIKRKRYKIGSPVRPYSAVKSIVWANFAQGKKRFNELRKPKNPTGKNAAF